MNFLSFFYKATSYSDIFVLQFVFEFTAYCCSTGEVTPLLITSPPEPVLVGTFYDDDTFPFLLDLVMFTVQNILYIS
jgi:hypothetical protein